VPLVISVYETRWPSRSSAKVMPSTDDMSK
jgi:hypothetical protein